MKEGLPEEELVMLKFTKTEISKELRWEHEKEFEYKKEMYDVIRTEVCGDTTIYFCWMDNEETLLNQKLTNWLVEFCQHNQQRKQSRENLLDFYQLLFWEECSDTAFDKRQIKRDDFFHYYFSLNDVYLLPMIPPPQAA